MTLDLATMTGTGEMTAEDHGQRGGSGWINTWTGRRFYPLDPDPAEIDIRDIAHALAAINRYNGHTDQPLSVAQHSVLVSLCVSPENALWGLLHDASEAYLGDVPRPLKRLPCMAPFREAEKRLMAAICPKFSLPLEEPAEVREIDAQMIPTEARELFKRRNARWRDKVAPLNVTFYPLRPQIAEVAFLMRFQELTGQVMLTTQDGIPQPIMGV